MELLKGNTLGLSKLVFVNSRCIDDIIVINYARSSLIFVLIICLWKGMVMMVKSCYLDVDNFGVIMEIYITNFDHFNFPVVAFTFLVLTCQCQLGYNIFYGENAIHKLSNCYQGNSNYQTKTRRAAFRLSPA